MSSRPSPNVGLRVALLVVWTILLIVGIAVGILVAVPGVGSKLQDAATATAAATTAAAVAAVALILIGLWGIVGTHRNLRHSIDVITEVDRARTETIQLETTRYLTKGK